MSNYDAFNHLSRSLFLNRTRLMPMISIYCDDSGTHPESRVAAVCGYISNVGQWELFTKEWKLVLKDFKVKEMHRSELESLHGEYKGWKERRKIDFLQKCHSIMKHRTKVAIGAAVIKKDFYEIIPDEFWKFVGGVYGWCAHECIVQARIWAEKCQRGYSDKFQWVFEGGTIGQGQVSKMFEEVMITQRTHAENWHIEGVSFQSKDVIPLQAADVIAYESWKHVENQIVDGGRRNIRLSMLDLHRDQDERYLKYWDRERLMDWVEV